MAERTETPQDFPIPPASFEFLVESVLMQTQIQLGLLHFEEDEEEAEPNLPLAKHSIDMLAMLEEKTRGNLSTTEQRLIENGLTELRFRYVQIVDEQKRSTKSSLVLNEKANVQDSEGEKEQPRIIMADGGKGSKTE